MKLLYQLLLTTVLFTCSVYSLKGETGDIISSEKKIIVNSIDSIHDQLKSELEEEYKFKAEFLNHRDETVDRWLDVLGILVAFFGVIVPIAFFLFSNKQLKENKKRLDEIDALKKETESKVEKTINESRTELNGMIARADENLNEIRDVKKEVNKISNELKMNDFKEIETTKISDYDSSNALDSLYKLADSYLEIPLRLDEARAIWNIIIKDFKLDKKDLAFVYYKMVEIERRDETRVDSSQKIFTLIDLAIQLDPENEYYYSKRAEIFKDYKKYREAEKNYSIAIKVSQSDSVFLHYWKRGDMKRLQGNTDGAIEDYDLAIQLAPDFYKLYESRAKTYLSKKYYLKALNDFSKVYKLMPYFTYSYLNSYELAILLKKQNEAYSLKNKCIEDDSTIVDYLNLLYGIIFEGTTDYKLDSIEEKLHEYKSSIEWSFDVSKEILKGINNKIANQLVEEYEQLTKKHNEQFK